MRLKYDDITLRKIKELVSMGESNETICEMFGVDVNYTSLVARINKIRRELNIPNKSKAKQVDDSPSSSAYIANVLKECNNSVDCLHDTVVSKLSDGFKVMELEMVTGYSKQIKDIICKFEDIQFLFDNIASIRKEK